MSQIAMIASPGSVKPDIETLTGDIGGAVSVDAAFNINLLTDNGLTSTGNPATNTITFALDGYTLGTAQTIGAVDADVVSIDLGAVASSWIIEAKVTGFNGATPAGCGYNLIGSARTNGAVAILNAIQDKIVLEPLALAGCDANLVAVGNTIVVRVTGAAGLTIDWKSVTVAMGV
jgi:hypothetical protein